MNHFDESAYVLIHDGVCIEIYPCGCTVIDGELTKICGQLEQAEFEEKFEEKDD